MGSDSLGSMLTASSPNGVSVHIVCCACASVHNQLGYISGIVGIGRSRNRPIAYFQQGGVFQEETIHISLIVSIRIRIIYF